ncbi:glutathionylspermidine synthase family protein [Profundibacterium mesophilum]|uniref:Glutathionylspermidine synthase n=1 Tax=Profundibacterium mesophilum KAUST100406-0324 TaxID=1037889 RepID=A0A921NYX7_9RHOB|nr:glutathionylspermidine synthase family protein [Profundibacterium mesophilum]KAF0676058.1 glutathionylspermidine synthase [Profundibacterium mesophilum KAUST100406-0324]
MRRMEGMARPDWREKARDAGFHFHEMHDAPYWDETSAYAFTLAQIEEDIEDPCTELHEMCRAAAEKVAASQELMERLCIPEAHRDLVAGSLAAGDPELYGRFDLAYDGTGPAKLLEYNADTPTSLFEAGSFQWSWLEDQIAAGVLPEGADQFNAIHERLAGRFAEIFAAGTDVHFASVGGEDNLEDYATAEAMGWAAREGGMVPQYTKLEEIGLSDRGQFTDGESRVIGALFKLYPWEDMLRDEFADAIAGSGCLILEPPWKAIVSNKGLLAVLWEMFEGHPNLLPAFFEADMDAGGAALDRAFAQLDRAHVRKPVFSREGASIEIRENGEITERAADRSYDAHPRIVQALHPLPVFDGFHPVLGAWVVGRECVGLGIREDQARITQDLSRFKPHCILD